MKVKSAGFFMPALIVLAFSCSIIQDGDIQSAEEAANLKLASIKIDQATQAGGTTTTTITPTVDQVVNISSTAGLLTRYVEFNAPAFSATSKIKYRTAVADGAKIWVYYFSTGKPSGVGIYKENVVSGKVKDSTFYEIYRFRYDASGRLNKFITILNPNTTPTTTNDTLIYGQGNQVATILRRGPNPSQIITVQYQGPLPAVQNISVAASNTPTAPFKNINGGNGCFDCASESASSLGYDQGNSNGGSGNVPLVITMNTLIGKPQLIQFDNVLNIGNAPDTYYFHPLMLLYAQLHQGDPLLHVYMVDWWKFGGNTGPTGNINFTDKVKFTFNYVKQ